MPEPIDIYADGVGVNIGAFGGTINFMLSSAMPAAPGTPAHQTRLASVRMSLEHLKTVAYILRQQVLEYERQAQVQVPVPQNVLNALGIGREDWNECWGIE